MTIDEAKARFEKIYAMRGDDEAAHSEEDRFREDVLEAIARGEENPVSLASIALSTSAIDFCRWCA
jgi:hypothetical protein